MGRSVACRAGIAAAAALLMVACGPSASVAELYPPQDDFCEEVGRSLSDEERIAAALLQAYVDPSLYHFQEFRSGIAQGSDLLQRQSVVDQYLQAHPDCCAIFPPAYLYQEWDTMIVEGEADRGALDDWNRDVKIARRQEFFGPMLDVVKGTSHWHRRIDSCGNTMEIDRG